MRLFTCLALWLLAINTAHAQIYWFGRNHKNHLELDKLNGKVKSVKQIFYTNKTDYKTNITKTVEQFYILKTYNKYGNIIREKGVKADSAISYVTNYYYNEKQQLSKIVKDPGNEIKNRQTHIYSYDKFGTDVEEKSTMFNGTVLTGLINQFKYDKNGRLIESVAKIPAFGTTKTKIRYNDEGKIIENIEIDMSKPNEIKSKLTYEYLPQKMLLYSWSYLKNTINPKPTLFIHTYDEHGNEVTSLIKEDAATEPDIKYLYEYDKNNNWIKKSSLNLKDNSTKATITNLKIISYYE